MLKRGWKRQVAAELGLSHLPLARFSFAFQLRAPAEGARWLEDSNAGLLAETPGALVFLGRGGVSITPHAAMRAVALAGFRGHWWVRLVLTDGAVLCLSVQEGPTAWGAHPATAGLGLRLHRSLAPPAP